MTRTASSTGSLAASSRRWYPRSSRSDVTPAAVLVSVADTLGRTVIAPSQLAAGLVTALIGAPYFVFLLYRSRATS